MEFQKLGRVIGDRKRVSSVRATCAGAAPCGLPSVTLLAPGGLCMRAFGAPATLRLPPPLRGTPKGVRCPLRSDLDDLPSSLDR